MRQIKSLILRSPGSRALSSVFKMACRKICSIFRTKRDRSDTRSSIGFEVFVLRRQNGSCHKSRLRERPPLCAFCRALLRLAGGRTTGWTHP